VFVIGELAHVRADLAHDHQGRGHIDAVDARHEPPSLSTLEVCMKLMAAAALALIGLAASAAEPAIFMSMKVEQDGNAIASPSVLVANAQQARVSVGDHLQIELIAANLSDRADLRMRVYAKSGESFSLVGAPRVVAAYGQDAVLAWVSQAGAAYRVTVKPVLAAAQ
jgi:ribosomal protein L21